MFEADAAEDCANVLDAGASIGLTLPKSMEEAVEKCGLVLQSSQAAAIAPGPSANVDVKRGHLDVKQDANSSNPIEDLLSSALGLGASRAALMTMIGGFVVAMAV